VQTLTITMPDDFHIHLRDGEYLAATVPHCANFCARAIVMPNLQPPVTLVKLAREYLLRIQQHIPHQRAFQPLMTLYLTEQTTSEEIILAKQSGIIFGAKFYPAGATTHSQFGISNWKNIMAVLEAMQSVDLPLLVHGEVTDPNTDIFDREALFINQVLEPLHRTFQQLRIVLEHVTTQEAVDFVNGTPDNIAATITVHHLLLNRNDLFSGGLRPHYYCLPILKRTKHQQALINAAINSRGKFFMGTDSAPHSIENKETACGCAGIYSAPVALPLYATLFEASNALNKLEGFCSHFGAKFYHLPINQGTITLQKRRWRVPSHYEWGNSKVIPLHANQDLDWQIKDA
jgi:dihydroorotase